MADLCRVTISLGSGTVPGCVLELKGMTSLAEICEERGQCKGPEVEMFLERLLTSFHVVAAEEAERSGGAEGRKGLMVWVSWEDSGFLPE